VSQDRGFDALRALLPERKHALALRLVMTGRRLDPHVFGKRGLCLSDAEAATAARWHDEGLETEVRERVVSADGSIRLVVRLRDGEHVETVAMPIGAVCVSSQVGCAVRCQFCASGLAGVKRNLTRDEILEQVVHARREMRIDRVVFMGMGEPTHNLENVLEAVARIKHDALISPTKQTVSTVGSIKALRRMSEAEVQPCLALSLHTADEELRARLLPNAPREALRDLVAAADEYGRITKMPVQYEWTLLEGVNDREVDVDMVCSLLAGTRGYLNFILWNPVQGLPFSRPDRMRAVAMVRAIKSRGILATIRNSSGSDVDAACGQLRRRALAGL
jgi:23S rRNA (adenine2503-C2)-methyltransferase